VLLTSNDIHHCFHGLLLIYDASTALSLADVRTLGEIPTQPHFSSFHLWSLTDSTSPPHTIPLTLYLVGYPWLKLILQLRNTMSLRTADLGSVCVRARPEWFNLNTPTEPPTIPSARASAWRAKRDPEAKMLSLQSFLRKGVSLGHVGRN